MATLVLRDSGSISSPGATAKGSPLTNLEVDNNFSNLNISIGVNSNLTTSNTANLVIAINELNSKIAVVNANVGLATSLTTGNTTNVVAAINELNSDKGAAAGTYGDASNVAVITVNSKGFITSVSNSAINIAGITGFSNSSPAGFEISTSSGTSFRANATTSGVTPSTYGGATSAPVIVVDAFGRITSASNVTSGASISNDTSSSGTTFYPLLSSITTGTLAAANVSSSKLFYQPSTGNLTSTIFTSTGNVNGVDSRFTGLLSTVGATITGTLTTKKISETLVAVGNSGTAATLDLSLGTVFTVTLTGSATLTVSNPTGVASFTVILTNDATPGRTVAWAGGSFVFPGGAASLSRTTTANAVDVWVFFSPNGGTTWYGNIAMKNMTA